MNEELLRLIHPFAGKTGIFHAVSNIEHDPEEPYITSRSYHVYKDGLLRKSFDYDIDFDEKEGTERNRRKAHRKAKEALDILLKYEEFTPNE